jgi:hypothetical protein
VQFDVVLTDLGMPEVSGWDVVEAAVARRPNMIIGVVTGWGETLDLKQTPSGAFRSSCPSRSNRNTCSARSNWRWPSGGARRSARRSAFPAIHRTRPPTRVCGTSRTYRLDNDAGVRSCCSDARSLWRPPVSS